MPSREDWRIVAAPLVGLGLAVAVLALVVGRDEVATATYLVHTSEARSLPSGGVLQTRGGGQIGLRFEMVEGDVAAEVARSGVAGVLFDEPAFRETPTELLRAWRRDGFVLVVLDLDAIAILDGIDCPPGGDRSPLECDSVLISGRVGDPKTLDRARPFVGMLYRDPRLAGDGHSFGWLQMEDPELPMWLASWGERAIEARAFVES